jgi:hypothetical protein
LKRIFARQSKPTPATVPFSAAPANSWAAVRDGLRREGVDAKLGGLARRDSV